MITQDEAIALMKKHSDSEESYDYVIKHVLAVQNVALRIANNCKTPVDTDLIRIGSILHDIGRFSTYSNKKERVKHGIIGADILRKEGLSESLARICERHIGVGILKSDIVSQGLPLPAQDYLPETKEEKIIAHADNLIFGHEEKTFQDVLDRFARELGPEHVERAKKLKKEIDSF